MSVAEGLRTPMRMAVLALLATTALTGCSGPGRAADDTSGGESDTDSGTRDDAGGEDASMEFDAGMAFDAGPGFVDAGEPDAGRPDAGVHDAGHPDAGEHDAGRPDAGEIDAGRPDAGHPDAGHPDAGEIDAGHPDAGHVDAGPESVACTIAATGVSMTSGMFGFSGDTLSCTGTVNGVAENCGTGPATVEHFACSNGHAFIVTGGTATLYIRFAEASNMTTWSAGAQFKGGLAMTGDITEFGIENPTRAAPSTGTVEGVSFVLQDTTMGQGIVANGDFEVTW